MKAGWHTNTLDEVCIFRNGLWTGKVPPFISVGVIRNTNFTKEGILDDSDIAFIQVEAKKYSSRGLNYGDIILEKSGGGPKQPVGRVVLFEKNDGEFSFSNFTSAITVRNKESLDFRFLHKYLYWIYLSGVTEGIQSNSTGIRNLDGNAYKSISIEYPSIVEQRRIVTILDEAFEGISIAKANTERNLNNARELFETYLQSVFTQRGEGWNLRYLSEIATTFGRGKSKHRPRGDLKLLGGAYPLIQTGEVANSNHYITEYSQTYSEFGLAQSKLWPKGTVCIAIVGANVAETAILDFDACFPDSVIGIVVNEQLADNEYVEFLLQSFKAILKEQGKGTARDNINIGTFENQKFPFPDVTMQNQIVTKINSLAQETDRLESIYQKKFNALEELKKSLLHKAFSGEL